MEHNINSRIHCFQIEAPSYASVCIDETNNKMTVSYGNNKEISAFKDGRYIVCKDGIMQLVIDEKGKDVVRYLWMVFISNSGLT